jgi:hypothetical protein
MTNFRPPPTARRATRARWCALAWGPLLASLACNTYGDPPGDVSTPLGGSGAESGKGSSGMGATVAGGSAAAGAEMGGSASGSAGAETSGGKAADMAGSGGSAGVATTVAGGGSGGSSGGSAGGGGESATDVDPIDGMEDDDQQIDLSDGRNGYWYVGGDPTVGGVTDPPTNKFKMAMLAAADRSMYAAHLKATGFTDWGSVIGFNLVEQSGVKAYDASAYCGVTFWAKAATAFTLRFRLPDGDTHQAGGVCVTSGAANQLCYDHFGAFVQVTTAWKSFSVKFTGVAQTGTGYHPADGKLKPSQLYAVEWALPGQTGNAYEIWIDDVAFMKCK